MRVRTVIGVLCAMVLVGGCAQRPGHRGSARVVGLMGGEPAYEIVESGVGVRSVTAYRIDGSLGARDDAGPDALHGYPVLAGPVPVDDASRATLVDVLTSDDTYLWDVAKACEFLPGVLVRWTGGVAEVDVLLCFSCDELAFYVDGRKAGREDFDPRRADLVRVAQRLFPRDAAIRRLRE